MNQAGTKDLKEIFGYQVVEYPKPVSLLEALCNLGASAGDVILDFFAGSATTAHAVLEQNNEDGGDRRFIMVQLPEPTENPEYPSIAEIGKERIRRVIGKRDESSFKIWDGGESGGDLAEQLRAFAENVREDRSQLDILYEILLKAGLPLTANVEQVEGREIYSVVSIAEGLLVICLEREVAQEEVDEISELRPERVVCLDTAFHGNDNLKTNAKLRMQSSGIEFRTV
jgi:adenine-specific DNA-methyltransferase